MQKKLDIIVVVRTPSSLKSGQGNGLAWSRLSVWHSRLTKPNLQSWQKSKQVFCAVCQRLDHTWLKGGMAPPYDESDTALGGKRMKMTPGAKIIFFFEQYFFPLFEICCFFSSLSFFGFFWSAGPGIFARKIIFVKANHSKVASNNTEPLRVWNSWSTANDCEFLKLVCWLSPCEQHTAMTCVMFGSAKLLFQITYCSPFTPDAKKHSNHPATQPRCDWYRFARSQGAQQAGVEPKTWEKSL